jgi:predicted metal-binding protein
MPLQTRLFEDPAEQFYPAGSEELVTGDFTKKTKKMVILMHYRHMLIPFEKLKAYVMDGREQRCQHGKPCKDFGRYYSCPPLSPTLERYNTENYRNVLVYCFYEELTPFHKADRIYRRQNAHRTLSPTARNYAKILEKLLGGKVAFDGSCHKCKPCNATKTPREPCKHYQELRCSLESLGINVVNLCKDVLHHQIFWWGEEEPPYLTVCHALLTNSQEPKKMVTIQ